MRRMLSDPKKRWVITDLAKEGVSLGWASEILTEMSREGYIERILKGPSSYNLLKYPDKLISDWVKWYRFKYNTVYSFYSPIKDIEDKLVKYLNKNKMPYALTLFSGAKRIAPYVNDPRVHIYIPDFKVLGDLIRFRENFNILEIEKTGNIHFVLPYYNHSIFKYLQNIKGTKVVSILQLYLDLYTFNLRGKEQAEYLLNYARKYGYPIT